MINYQKLNDLTKKRGINLSFISKKLGKSRTYLANCINSNTNIPDKTVDEIATILGTTFEYLTDRTDENSAPAVNYSKRTRDFIELYDSLTDSQKALIDSMIEEFSKS